MKHHNRYGDVHYHLSHLASKRLYTSVCEYFFDIKYPTYFQINLAFICFISPFQINLTVLQYLKYYQASLPSRWPHITISARWPSSGIIRLTYIPYIFKLTSPSFVLFNRSIKFNHMRVSYPFWILIIVMENSNTISAGRTRYNLICPSVYVLFTHNFPHNFKLTSPSFVLLYCFT